MDGFENLNDEDIQQLMALGIIPEQMEGLKSQMQTAQSLRDRGPPKGTDTGRVYVAANPLEHLAYALEGMKAGKEIDRSRAEQQKLLAEQIRGRGKYFNRMNDISPVQTTVGPMQEPPPGGY
jgi:uncharacterized protein with von Willebrand factor type A (vWA) domain